MKIAYFCMIEEAKSPISPVIVSKYNYNLFLEKVRIYRILCILFKIDHPRLCRGKKREFENRR